MPKGSLRESVLPLKAFWRTLITPYQREARVSVGLDIGSTSVKCVALGPARGQNRAIVGNFLIPVPTAEKDLPPVLKQAVGNFNFPVKKVNLGIGGQSIIMRVVEMTAMEEHELKQALPFEAQRYLPFSIKEVILDGQILGPAGSKKNWVLIVACKRAVVQKHLELVQAAGLEVGLIDVDALAMTNSFFGTQRYEDGESFALVNLGGGVTNMVICRDGIPCLVRDIPWGGKRLVREISQQAGCSEEKVQRALKGEDADATVLETLKAVSESLVVELQLSFDYFENQFGRPPERLFLTGAVAQSRAVLDALGKHINQPLAAWAPAESLSAAYAVAYGLALRAAP